MPRHGHYLLIIHPESDNPLQPARLGAGSERRREEERQRREFAQLQRAALAVAKEHHRLSVLWRCGWRPWRALVHQAAVRLRTAEENRCEQDSADNGLLNPVSLSNDIGTPIEYVAS
jgi:hypothetical protein